MQNERRDLKKRGAIVRFVLDQVVTNPSVTLSIATLQEWLCLPTDGAKRILGRLMDAGVVREIERGVWVPAPLAHASR